MTACDYCGREIESRDDVVRARVSTGFGQHNVEIHRFGSRECRARWRGEDPVLATSKQASLAAYSESAADSVDEVVWSL